MGIRVRELVTRAELGLELVGGRSGAEREVVWVHTSELPDPTPWLSGGELLLTTGMRLNAGSARRRYLRRLAAAGLAGLGFGTGFGFDEVPGDLCEEADELAFPVLKVPYETPFIAISKAVSSALTAERTRELERSLRLNQRLTGAMALGAGAADLLDEVAAESGAWLVLFDLRGEVIATSPEPAPLDPAGLWAELPPIATAPEARSPSAHVEPGGSWVALPVTAAGRKEAVLVLGRPGRLSPAERAAARDAANAMGLLLTSRRAIADAERRVAGDVIGEALAGALGGPALARRLELLGFPPGGRAYVLVAEPHPPAGDLDEIAGRIEAALTARTRVRVAAVADHLVLLAPHPGPDRLAETVADLLAREGIAARIGVGRSAAPVELRDSYRAARLALRGAPREAIARADDPSSYGVLLGSCPPPLLEGYVDGVLGPLRDSPVLVASVRAFVEAGGRWEVAARRLGVHRHTLRYRVGKAEDLLGRDLSSPDDRFEVWMALKAADAAHGGGPA